MAEVSMQSRRTRTAIRRALMKLLQSHSIGDITMSMLAEEADMNRSTIYRYYNSMFDVLGDCICEVVGAADWLIPPADSQAHLMAQVSGVISRSYRGIRDNRDLYALLQQNYCVAFGTFEHVSLVKDRAATCYHNFIEDLAQLGITFVVPDQYVEATLCGISESIVSCWIEADFNSSVDEMAQRTVELFENVIRTFTISSPLQ